jgi:glycosyltransferase involved in cell wall biosynthesis
MSISSPLVSIVTPTKNRSSLLRETILSVVSQTYTNWEMLIIDDFSTDNTIEMLKEFSGENRFTYYKRKGEISGAQTCRNEGIDLAKGEYIILLDSDDLLSTTCLENRVKFIANNPELDFAVFPTIIFGWEYPNYDTYWNLPNNEDDIVRFLNWDPLWQTASVIWKKKSILSIYPFSKETLSFQDIEIHIRAILFGLKYIFRETDPDNFHREHESERIGHHTNNIQHLISHEKLLVSIYSMLNEKKMLNDGRKLSLAGFYFRVCTFWVQNHNLKKALSLWKSVSDLHLINTYTYCSAIIYFSYRSVNRNERIPILSRMRLVFQKLLPADFFLLNNTWKKIKKNK